MNEKLIQISLFVEGVTENHTPGALVGELFANILCDGFKRLQKGDRFWFEYNRFTSGLLFCLFYVTAQIITDFACSLTTKNN